MNSHSQQIRAFLFKYRGLLLVRHISWYFHEWKIHIWLQKKNWYIFQLMFKTTDFYWYYIIQMPATNIRMFVQFLVALGLVLLGTAVNIVESGIYFIVSVAFKCWVKVYFQLYMHIVEMIYVSVWFGFRCKFFNRGLFVLYL